MVARYSSSMCAKSVSPHEEEFVSEFEQPVNIRHTNKESIAPKKIVVFIDNIFMFFLQFYKIYFI